MGMRAGEQRVAILMLAHRNDEVLRTGLERLSASFDIYLHFDRRVRDCPGRLPVRVRLIRRRRVYHGSFRQILATLDLFRAAAAVGYDRYVLVSGQDLPLKTNREIQERLAADPDCDFITFVTDSAWLDKAGDRLGRFHPDRLRGAEPDSIGEAIRLLMQRFWCAVANRYLDLRGTGRQPIRGLAGGPNWMDLTHDTVSFILTEVERRPDLLRRFRWTRFGDEHFIQTLLAGQQGWRRPMRPVLRYVDWESGPEFPRLLRFSDFEQLRSSDALFARKFDASVDRRVIGLLMDGDGRSMRG